MLPSAFDEYLSEPDYDKGPDVDVPAPAPAPRWGHPEDFTWDESAVGADDDVQDAEEGWRAEGDAGAEGGTEADTEAATEAGTAEDVFPEGAPGGDDDDGVEYWPCDGLPEKLPIPTYPPRNRKRPHPSSQNRYSRPPSPRHKPNDHKRQAYTAAEKLKWVAQLDVAVSVRALARESGIHRKCLANWKHAADFLKEAHSARCRMHGRGRASWYRPMEIKRRERGIETTWIINADQASLWLEMPATTTVDQTGVRSVPIRSAGYQKERVTVMLACTADGMKLRPWVFFKRKTMPKGVFPPDVVVSCHENGWMDANGVIQWLEECVKPFLKPGFRRHARSSMVVLDSYRGHLIEAVKEKFRELNCVPAIIPSGCTAEVQPLDASINKSFKASVRQQYQKWFQEEGQEQLTRAGTVATRVPILLKGSWNLCLGAEEMSQGSGDATENRNEPPPSKIEGLDGSNYEEWSGRMQSAFKRYKLLKLAMGEEKMSEEGDARDWWIEKSTVLYDIILQSVNNDMLQHIKDLVELDDSGPKAWKLLHDVIQPNSLPMGIVLEKELAALSMRLGNDVKPVLDQIKNTYARMAAAGSKVSQMQQCTKIISVLDNSWDNLIPTLNTQQDQWTLEWIRQQILQEDFCRRLTGGGAANKTAEGYGAAGGSKGRGGGRGRGRGRVFGRGRGRGDYNEGHESSGGRGSTRMEGACWYCKKAGHPWFKCFSWPEGWAPRGMKPPSGERARGGAVQGSGAQGSSAQGKANPGMFLMVEYVKGNESNVGSVGKVVMHPLTHWVIDSGCTSHMTPRADLLDEVKPPGKIKFVAVASGALLPVIGVGNAKNSCIKDLWQLPIIPWNGKPPATAAAAATAIATTGGEETAPTDGALDAVKKVQQTQQPHGEVLAGVDATAAWAKASSRSAKAPLALVHMDVVGPTRAPSLSGSRYLLTVWVYPLKTKGEVAVAVVKEWMPRAQRESGHKVKVICTDNGGEFIGADFEAVLKKKGIQHQLTVPYNPQHNGVAEHFNRTL
ncbi:unnamed protein product [Closterium sp. NIES-54]